MSSGFQPKGSVDRMECLTSSILAFSSCAGRCLHSLLAATSRGLGVCLPFIIPERSLPFPSEACPSQAKENIRVWFEPSEGRWSSKLLPKAKGGHRENPIQEDIMGPVENHRAWSRWA